MRWFACLCILLLIPFCAVSESFTPGHERCGKQHCYWETPMDITDVDAVWQMLTQPMTVLRGDSRRQAYVYGVPDEKSTPIGEVTYSCQGVHVLEVTNDGWAKIEAYSSGFADSTTGIWNTLICGYVPANLLATKEVRTQYGMVVDKLTQRLYLFCDGKLLDTLTVSTGLSSPEQPYNETRSGEFVLYSRTGQFKTNRMISNMGIRFNDGDMLHEVPHLVYSNGRSDYSQYEAELGQRASHGCVHVQRKRTPKGINMTWIWNAMKTQLNTRIVIWEDWTGRQIPLPADDTALYFNLDASDCYHTAPTCFGVKDQYHPMTSFTYAELADEPYASLMQCNYCYPALRPDEIEAINAAHR